MIKQPFHQNRFARWPELMLTNSTCMYVFDNQSHITQFNYAVRENYSYLNVIDSIIATKNICKT